MGKTISTHNGSVANREHNIRNPRATDKQGHIDKSLKAQNEILHDEKPREAYRRIFGEALAEYNSKQLRPERQIRDYFAHVEKDSKKHAVYEMIVQIGDRNDTGIDAPTERECLKEFYAGWSERNPNLECIGAYLHADEADGTLHMHLDYVPVATGYSRGMATQNGLVKALEQQGFTKQGSRTAQIQWEARENAALESICERHGIEVIHPNVEKRRHLDTDLYKAEKKVEAALETYNSITRDATELQRDLDAVKTEVDAFTQKKDAAAGELKQSLHKLAESRDMLLKADGVNKRLQGQKEALQGQITALETRKTEIEREIPALAAQILDARKELSVVERAVNEKKTEVGEKFGWDTLDKVIEDARKEAAQENRIRELERQVKLQQRVIDFLRNVIRERLPEMFRAIENKINEIFHGLGRDGRGDR